MRPGRRPRRWRGRRPRRNRRRDAGRPWLQPNGFGGFQGYSPYAPVSRRRRGGRRLAAVLYAAAVLATALLMVSYFYPEALGPLGEQLRPTASKLMKHLEEVGEYLENMASDTYSYLQDKAVELGLIEDREKIIREIVDYINAERAKVGVPPVRLVNMSIAQYRAEDMAARKYYGHCDPEGRHPGYYYTMLGGVYAMEENIGIVYGDSPSLSDIKKVVKEMIHSDSHADWLHRDSLLDPTNNLVDIGVAEAEHAVFLVIHMQKAWVEWRQPPRYDENTGRFTASGTLLLKNSRIESIVIYKWPRSRGSGADTDLEMSIPEPIIYGSMESYGIRETCSSYDLGEPVAGVVPSRGMFYPGLETIVADTWIDGGGDFTVSFKWRPREPGLYTIVIYAKNTIGVKHPYDSSRYADAVPVLEYTVAYQWG